MRLKYKKTTLLTERRNANTTGLTPLSVRPAQYGYPILAISDPEMPIASAADPRLTLDVEGIVANPDGRCVLLCTACPILGSSDRSYWLSDEYGPYIYRFSASGHLLQSIQPPSAVLPRDSSGQLSFTSDVNPSTGRKGNQGA